MIQPVRVQNCGRLALERLWRRRGIAWLLRLRNPLDRYLGEMTHEAFNARRLAKP